MEERVISREIIKEHAVTLFIQNGVDATSINKLVELCGIAKGTFYLYFKNKNDLVEEVFDQYRKDFIIQVIDNNKDIHNVNNFANSLIKYFDEQPIFLIELRKHINSFREFDYIEKTVLAFNKIIMSYFKFYEDRTISNIEIYNQAIIVMILEVCYQGIVTQEKDETIKILCDIFKRFFGCD